MWFCNVTLTYRHAYILGSFVPMYAFDKEACIGLRRCLHHRHRSLHANSFKPKEWRDGFRDSTSMCLRVTVRLKQLFTIAPCGRPTSIALLHDDDVKNSTPTIYVEGNHKKSWHGQSPLDEMYLNFSNVLVLRKNIYISCAYLSKNSTPHPPARP